MISSLHSKLDSLTDDLDTLTKATNACDQKYQKIHSQLGPKWNQIRKLSQLESDFSKLKNLQDLPS